MSEATAAPVDEDADWHRRVVGRSLRTAAERSVDRGRTLIVAAAAVLERSDGEDITVQEVADEAGQSLRTLYQYFAGKEDLLLAVFEEAMRTYADLVRAAIEDLDDPLDRLAGAMVAAVSMPAFSDSGFDRGLARLRLRLAEAKPEQVGRAQLSVTTLVHDLVEEAVAAGRITVDDPDGATFMLLSLNAVLHHDRATRQRRRGAPPGHPGVRDLLPARPGRRGRPPLVEAGDRAPPPPRSPTRSWSPPSPRRPPAARRRRLPRPDRALLTSRGLWIRLTAHAEAASPMSSPGRPTSPS